MQIIFLLDNSNNFSVRHIQIHIPFNCVIIVYSYLRDSNQYHCQKQHFKYVSNFTVESLCSNMYPLLLCDLCAQHTLKRIKPIPLELSKRKIQICVHKYVCTFAVWSLCADIQENQVSRPLLFQTWKSSSRLSGYEYIYICMYMYKYNIYTNKNIFTYLGYMYIYIFIYIPTA